MSIYPPAGGLVQLLAAALDLDPLCQGSWVACLTPRSFSSSVVVSVLATVCARAGLNGEGAELIRIGENAIYRLADPPIVVRITRPADRMSRVRKELCIAR